MRTFLLCIIVFLFMLAIDVLATKEPKDDILDLLKKEKSMAQQDHRASDLVIQESQQATALKVEKTVRAVAEAENMARRAIYKMTTIQIQLDSILTGKDLDTLLFKGAVYEGWIQYRDSGGLDEFDNYRMNKN